MTVTAGTAMPVTELVGDYTVPDPSSVTINLNSDTGNFEIQLSNETPPVAESQETFTVSFGDFCLQGVRCRGNYLHYGHH